jgi:hypothetical protein
VDGLLTKINYDFLLDLKNYGLLPSKIRVKYVSRDSKTNTVSTITFETFNQFISYHSDILNSNRYLCFAGEFPVIQNLVLDNLNLNFLNNYSWLDITNSKRLLKTLPNDMARSTIYETTIQKYLDLMNEKIDAYVSNARNGIKVRLNSYMDPCYVDAGYVSPNAD